MKKTISLILLLLVSVFSYSQDVLTNDEIIQVDSFNLKRMTQEILTNLNLVRKSNSREEFKYCVELENSSQFHSDMMKVHGFFGHRNIYVSGYETPTSRVLKFNGNYPFIAENIANISLLKSRPGEDIEIKLDDDGNIKYYSNNGTEVYFHTYKSFAKRVVLQWMNSKNHKRNILNPDYLETGIGVVIYSKGEGAYKTYYALITQDMGGY